MTIDESGQPVTLVCTLPDCGNARTIAMPTEARFPFKWAPDARGLCYLAGDLQNVWLQPLDGTTPRQLTHFSDTRPIADYAWSRDGKRLATLRGTPANDVVLFKGLKPQP